MKLCKLTSSPLFLAALGFLFSSGSYAQETRANLSGTIADASGAANPRHHSYLGHAAPEPLLQFRYFFVVDQRRARHE